MSTTALDRIKAALEAKHLRVTTTGPNTMQAQCPAHEDRNPSLSIKGIEGQVLVYCHAGCATADVLAALNLTMSDLYDNPRGASYTYLNRDRIPVRTVHRTPDKDFRQSGITGTPTLYRLPEVTAAVANDLPVYLVEGEKDVHAIESLELGLPATTAPQGARNVAKCDMTPLQGAHVIAIVDRDEAGHAWASEVARLLEPTVAKLKFRQAAVGKDAADHIAAGRTLADLQPYTPPDTPRHPAEPPHGPRARLKHRLASTVVVRAVRWLWNQHIPLGEIVLLAGREGVGKSTFLFWLVAQITRGVVAGEYTGTPRSVIIVATEDSWAHTIVPRLMAENADLDRVIQVEAIELLDDDGNPVGDTPILLPRDLAELEDLIRESNAAAVILDPLMSRMGDGLDTHVDRDVRTALEPLARIAHDTGTAIVGIIHQNKSSNSDVVNTIMGSRAFAAVARAVLVAMRDPANPNQRIVGVAKANLGPDDPPAWAYRVEGVQVGKDPDDHRPVVAARYVDLGRHHSSIRDAGHLAANIERQTNREQTTTTGAAEKWLRELLEDAGPAGTPRARILELAADREFSTDVVRRAREAIGVETRRDEFQGATTWRKPPHGWKGVHASRARGDTKDASTATTANIGPLAEPTKPLETTSNGRYGQLRYTPRARAREDATQESTSSPICATCGQQITGPVTEYGTHITCPPASRSTETTTRAPTALKTGVK